MVSENPELRSFIVSGRELKAFNQWFNKERAKLRRRMDGLRNALKEGRYEEGERKRVERELRELEIRSKVLSAHRKRWMDTQLHRIARKVVDILYETGHRAIYIGKNALESKNGINLGSKTNQEFVSIPFRRLIELIRYKAEALGMEVVEVDESYTSKTSPFADIRRVQRLGRKRMALRAKPGNLGEGKERGDGLEEEIEELERKMREARKGYRNGNVFKDDVVHKVFHADLVGALNILRVGAKLLRLGFYENSKTLFIFFKVTPESLLGIGGSSGNGLSLSTGTFPTDSLPHPPTGKHAARTAGAGDEGFREVEVEWERL